MSKIIQALKVDVNFVKSHTLQPKWYKLLKFLILAGFLGAYYLLFGFVRTVTFLVCFFTLSLIVHMVYRVKTNVWTNSWLDFVVEDGTPNRIGIFYYSAVIFNAILSVVISQVFFS